MADVEILEVSTSRRASSTTMQSTSLIADSRARIAFASVPILRYRVNGMTTAEEVPPRMAPSMQDSIREKPAA